MEDTPPRLYKTFLNMADTQKLYTNQFRRSENRTFGVEFFFGNDGTEPAVVHMQGSLTYSTYRYDRTFIIPAGKKHESICFFVPNSAVREIPPMRNPVITVYVNGKQVFHDIMIMFD